MNVIDTYDWTEEYDKIINPLYKHFIILLKESYTMCRILDIIQVKG